MMDHPSFQSNFSFLWSAQSFTDASNDVEHDCLDPQNASVQPEAEQE